MGRMASEAERVARRAEYAAKRKARKAEYDARREDRKAKYEAAQKEREERAEERKAQRAARGGARNDRPAGAHAATAEVTAIPDAATVTVDQCAVGPCTQPRVPGSSYCAKHGPTKAFQRRAFPPATRAVSPPATGAARRAARDAAKTIEVVQYRSAKAFEADAQRRAQAGWTLAGQSQVPGQTHRIKKAMKRGLLLGVPGVGLGPVGAASGLLSGKRDAGIITVTWVRQPPGSV